MENMENMEKTIKSRTQIKNKRNEAQREMRPHAKARYIRISPSKVRIVLDVVRRKPVVEALAMLEAIPNASAEVTYKLIKSAVANAENCPDSNSPYYGVSRADLYVAEIYADGGPILKRMNPVSKGRAHRINKRTSHITVILDTIKEGN